MDFIDSVLCLIALKIKGLMVVKALMADIP